MNHSPIHSLFGEDTPRARRNDTETSHEAADSNHVAPSIADVLDILTQYGPKADHELVGLMESLGYPYMPQRIRTARSALRDRNAVRWNGGYRLTPNGRRARVWEVGASAVAVAPIARVLSAPEKESVRLVNVIETAIGFLVDDEKDAYVVADYLQGQIGVLS